MLNHRHTAVAILVLLISIAGCQKGSKDTKDKDKLAAGSNQGSAKGSGAGMSAPAPVAPAKDIDSKDILARTETSPEVYVKHVLLGWKDLATARSGPLDPRAAKRSNAEAAQLAQDLAGKLKANPDSIDALVKENSEDPGSLGGDPYTVKPDSQFVPEFKNLAIRLKEKEVGIVKTTFGYHVMERVPPPLPDPLESADILARPPEAGPVQVQHVLIGWKDVPSARQRPVDKRAAERTKADADKLAKEVLDKVRAKGDMAKLMKEFSEDPGSKDSAEIFEITHDKPFVEPFKNLSLRLKLNEAGLVKSPFGWHIIKRVPPPPPDPLESADILKRSPEAGPVQVQQVLIAWKDVPSAHQRPVDKRAAERTKADADKLAKQVLDKVRANGDMAKLMKEYSEDADSKDNARILDIATDTAVPDAFKSFKNLALRLKLNEAGIVKSPLGWHILKHVPPPPPDPLESADILKRTPETAKAKVKHILLGWDAVHADDERGKKRDRKTLEQLVKDTVAKLKKGDKIEPLMAELSEDPGSAKAGTSYDVSPEAGLVPPFKNLSLRLKVGEVGVVKTNFGIHIIQRTE